MQIAQRVFEILLNPENKRSQLELASYLGISDKTVGAWKTRNSDPPAKYIPAIADFLGVSVERLLTGEEKNFINNFDNRSISGGTVLQGTNNSGTLNINGNQKELSSEILELIRIYESLDVKSRHKLMDVAFKLEEEINQQT